MKMRSGIAIARLSFVLSWAWKTKERERGLQLQLPQSRRKASQGPVLTVQRTDTRLQDAPK